MAVPSYTSWETFHTLFSSDEAHNLVPTILYGAALFSLSKCVKLQLAAPVAIVVALPIFYLIAACAGM
jgi:hypothetical protein